ncbi:hypothetical protein E2562_005576 [Oryza meyeriana var. granulata]|uniref:Uncharacterized protein n=1 Tax=Oryza meyeriana var. granulata TaxID=110450 RepID=A0A6G1F472_9ORYZ|nr:hypothetical protein E2562_005576 [Oryza meyeriana var. granulata]
MWTPHVRPLPPPSSPPPAADRAVTGRRNCLFEELTARLLAGAARLQSLEHNYSAPTHRNSLFGTTRNKLPTSTSTSAQPQPLPPSGVVVGAEAAH